MYPGGIRKPTRDNAEVHMLVTFRSKAGASITMFGDHALRLLELMGASGKVPGAFNPEDVPAALRRLQAGLQAHTERTMTPAPPALNEDRAEDEDEDDEPRRAASVSLATRAAPLVDLLQRAAASKTALIWEKTG
jgi:hypothetical protein